MKRLGLLALLLTNASAYAVNPVEGWYGGILLGINYTPSTQYNFPTSYTPPPEVPITIPSNVDITLNYKTMGQIAGQVGYRFCEKFRVEGQLGYNNSPYSSLKINKVTLLSEGTSPYYSFQGAANTVYGMINGFYDFIPSAPDSNFAPFVGVGVGYAYTKNYLDLAFWFDSTKLREDILSRTTTSPAGQAIIGASYFLDDFAFFGLDFRYFITSQKTPILNERIQIASLNLTFNGAFDLG